MVVSTAGFWVRGKSDDIFLTRNIFPPKAGQTRVGGYMRGGSTEVGRPGVLQGLSGVTTGVSYPPIASVLNWAGPCFAGTHPATGVKTAPAFNWAGPRSVPRQGHPPPGGSPPMRRLPPGGRLRRGLPLGVGYTWRGRCG